MRRAGDGVQDPDLTAVTAGAADGKAGPEALATPADLAATLSVQELVDLVAWLETLKQAN